jgi:hypothetical protein
MNTEQNKVPEDMEKLKEIPKWARRYSQSRTAPLIIFSLIFIVLFGLVSLGVYCFLRGSFALAVIMMVLYLAGFLYFVITWDRHEERYFTTTGIPQSESVEKIRKFLPLPLIACAGIQVLMEILGVFPAHLRLPISVVYVCPLLVFANWRWARGSFIGYLWATLYGAWAIAILFNVPILTFPKTYAGYEMIAVPVTGVITGLVAYIYSRYALKKLKTTAHLEENTNGQ